MKQKFLQPILICFIFILPLSWVSAEIIPDISGTWILNVKLSDDYQEKIRKYLSSARSGNNKPDGVTGASSKGSARGSKGHPSYTNSGRPSGTTQYGGIGAENPRVAMKNTLKKNSVLFSEKIRIIQNDPEIILASPGTRQRIIYTDGRGISVSASSLADNLIEPYIAMWEKSGQLVIETNTHKGLKIEEFFMLPQDGKHLGKRGASLAIMHYSILSCRVIR